MSWFDVDKAGLAQLMERRGMAFVPMELLQNAWDEDGVTEVSLTMAPIEGKRMAVQLVISDDSPNGFHSLADAWTLFAASYKKGDADKRGRFNLGEKLVLAVCREATITTTTGTVVFGKRGRMVNRQVRRNFGTMFSADVRMGREQCAEALRALGTLIPPMGITTTINGLELPHRTALAEFTVQLPTEVADDEGVLRRRRRKCTVCIYEPLPGEEAKLYELGIPVQTTGDRWHVDVWQKVPLTLERDSVPPAYLAKVRAAVVNHMHEQLEEEDAGEPWLTEAVGHKDATVDAIDRSLDLRFGVKRVMMDPSDPEANRRAQAAGYTVVHPRQLAAGVRTNLKRVEKTDGRKLVIPAGRIFPTRGTDVFEPDECKQLPKAQWNKHHRRVAHLVALMGQRLLQYEVRTVIVDHRDGGYTAAYSRGVATFNLAHLRGQWWSDTTALGWDAQVRLIIHELAHHLESNHLDDAYHRACCLLGARLARQVALGAIAPAGMGYTLE